jgi:Uma2 family endonuclease
MGARTAITVADLEKLAPPPEHEGKAWELSEGELILVGNAKFIHERVKTQVARILTEFVAGKRMGTVMVESGIALSDRTFRIPDVMLIPPGSSQSVDDQGIPCFVPALVVEVVSDSEKPSDVEAKLRQYLAHGTREVWQVYLELRAMSVSTATEHKRLYSDDILTSSLLPSFATPVSAFFEPLP